MPKILGTAPNGGTIIETDDGRQIITTPDLAQKYAPDPVSAGPVADPLPVDPLRPVSQAELDSEPRYVPSPFGAGGQALRMPDGKIILGSTQDMEDVRRGVPTVGEELQKAGVQTGGYFPKPADEKKPEGDQPAASFGADGKLVLGPSFANLSPDQQRKALADARSAPKPEQPKVTMSPDQFVGGTTQPPAGGASSPTGVVSGAMKGSVPSFVPSGVSGGGLSRAFNQQEAAVNESAKIGAQKAAETSAFLEQSQAEAEKRAAVQLQREQERAAYVKSEEDKLRALMDDTSKQTEQVDPNRWWSSRETGQKVLAGISAFLSGFGGGPDPIQQAIRDDIGLQREALDRKDAKRKEMVGYQQTLLGLARQRFGDERAADLAAEATATNLAQQRLQTILSRTGSQEALARGKELAAQLEVNKQTALSELAARNESLAIQRQGLQLDAIKTAAAAQAAGAKATEEQNKLLVPGVGNALTEKDATELKDQKIAYDNVTDIIRRMVAIRKEYGSETLPTDAKKTMGSLESEFVGAMNQLNRFGALDNGTQAILDKVKGGGLAGFQDPTPALMSVKLGLDRKWNNSVFERTGKRPGQSVGFIEQGR